MQNQHLFCETVWIFWNVSNAFLLYALTTHVVETSTIQYILFDFLLVLSNVNFLSFFWSWVELHSCDFLIECFLLKSPCDFLTEIFWYVLVVDIVRSTFENVLDILASDLSIESRMIEVVVLKLSLDDLNIVYGRFISHECFDKMCRLFQLFWCFWSAVTTVSNRGLETIDACRWRSQ